MKAQPNWMRRLTPAQEDAIRASFDRGVKATALATAYGVTVRTIYRTLERTKRDTVTVQIGGYHAIYALGEEGPIQLTPWRAA